ncbi:MAG: hypothetical protein D6704_11735 [Nitrospirae bacterium]|nr:MAG: hypothetical protein D6704_11735 [Nitrospirota bacterium]
MHHVPSTSSHAFPFAGSLDTWLHARAAIGLLLLIHVGIVCLVFPPWKVFLVEPLLVRDHTVHTHRIQMYREAFAASGWPWGYDPRVAAGLFVDPKNDVGAKPQQLLGLALYFLSPGTVERLFLFGVMLTMPLWTLLACRRLNIPLDAQVWILVVLLIPGWLYENLPQYLVWGLIAFAAASYFAPYVLAVFLNFLEHPTGRRYVLFLLAGAVLFCLHVLGPMVVAPTLLVMTLLGQTISSKWRFAVLGSPIPIFLLNAVWAVPCFWAFWTMSFPPRPTTVALDLVPHLAKAHMTYDNLAEVLEILTPMRVLVLGGGGLLTVYGLSVLKDMTNSRVATAFALAGGTGLAVKFFGSFLPGIALMQPARFVLPSFVLLTVPVGLAMYQVVKTLGWPVRATALGIVLVVMAAGAGMNKLPAFASEPPSVEPLVTFIHNRTQPDERLLIQSMAWEPRVYPLLLQREVVGNTFPFVKDPAQFLPTLLWGRPINTWEPETLRAILDRWGITWCFTHNAVATSLFQRLTGTPGITVGPYHAFHVGTSSEKFLLGEGRVEVSVNRIELAHLRAQNGLVVLRYRYHPAWEATPPVRITPYPIPEDPIGFLALNDPPENVTLTFRPWKMLHVTWPGPVASP